MQQPPRPTTIGRSIANQFNIQPHRRRQKDR
jgi:hypothetical protein